MAKKLNAEWHSTHRMPRNATREERVRWHSEHSEACGCRPVPGSLAAEVKALRLRSRAQAR